MHMWLCRKMLVTQWTSSIKVLLWLQNYISMELAALEHFKNPNHPPYLWNNFILVYMRKVIRIIALLWHILVFFFNFFLQKNHISIIDNHVGSHGLLRKTGSLCISYLSNIKSCSIMFYYYWQIIRSNWIWKICGWWI